MKSFILTMVLWNLTLVSVMVCMPSLFNFRVVFFFKFLFQYLQVNGRTNPSNSYRTHLRHPITAQQLQNQIYRLQKMLKELKTLEYKQLHQKPLTSPISQRNRIIRLTQPSNDAFNYLSTRPLMKHQHHFHLHPRNSEMNNRDSYHTWYPFYSTYLRTPFNSHYSI